MKVTADSSNLVLRSFFIQLRSSVTLISLLLLTILTTILKIFLSDDLWIAVATYVQYTAAGISLVILSIAFQTAVHEQGHLAAAKRLGVKAVLTVNRIGDVWFELPDLDRLSDDEKYEIVAGPYARLIDLAIPWFLMAIWVAYSLRIPSVLMIIFSVLTILYLIMALATVAGYLTYRYKLASGRIVWFAWFFTSRGDLASLINYHKRMMETPSVEISID